MERYHEDGVDGLQTRPRSDRPSKLSTVIAGRIKKQLMENKQGFTTKQAYELIANESEGVHYHEKYIYELLHGLGFKEKAPRKVHVNTASEEERKRNLKKGKGNPRPFTRRFYCSIFR
jgi:transposase